MTTIEEIIHIQSQLNIRTMELFNILDQLGYLQQTSIISDMRKLTKQIMDLNDKLIPKP
jgi:hypothetical protein